MNSPKLALLLILLALVGCQNPYNQLNEQYARGEITRTQYLDLWAAQQRKDQANAKAWADFNASLQTANQNMQAQAQQNIAQTQAMISQQQQQTNQTYQAFGQQMATVNAAVINSASNMRASSGWPSSDPSPTASLPTTAQLMTPGVWTGRTQFASDGTMYKEYRRTDGSTYWSR